MPVAAAHPPVTMAVAEARRVESTTEGPAHSADAIPTSRKPPTPTAMLTPVEKDREEKLF